MPSQSNRGVGFFGMVAGAMALLKVKERWDDYRQVSSDEEARGEVALSSASPETPYKDDDEVRESLLNTEIPATRTRKSRRKADCCVCCGLRCGLFWKAFGIVLLITIIYNAVKLILWATTAGPTGLEGMPQYDTSLECSVKDAPHLYNGSVINRLIPLGAGRSDHALDFRGDAVGTITIAQGKPGATQIEFDLALRASDKDHLDLVTFRWPEADADGTTTDSRILVNAPGGVRASGGCMRYDATIYLPPTLKKLHVQSHTRAHIRFAEGADVELEDMFVTMYKMDHNNLLLPHEGIRAQRLVLEVYRGWIVGEANILESTSITTQRGDGIINVKAIPVATDTNIDTPAILNTLSGTARTDIEYSRSGGHRAISSRHQVQNGGDMYLRYAGAGFSGPVSLKAKSYTAKNLLGVLEDEGRWAGQKDGGDSMEVVSAGGWVGVYF